MLFFIKLPLFRPVWNQGKHIVVGLGPAPTAGGLLLHAIGRMRVPKELADDYIRKEDHLRKALEPL